ncbi:MAG: LemA family protein [Armatimonadetes bacterium]|nr:LemA family protein [Armatimonadota bacterium]
MGFLAVVLLGFILLAVIVALWWIGIYNRLIALRNEIENLWSQIDVQLRRRFDLIPNLVETVKGYASHEKEIFEKVAEARAQMLNAKSPTDQVQADNMLTGALKSLFAVAEAYPDLKANQNFLSLQEELSSTETQIARARETYNDAVMSYNTLKQSFPASIVASTGGFGAKPYFPVEEEAREPVKVSFA